MNNAIIAVIPVSIGTFPKLQYCNNINIKAPCPFKGLELP